MNLFWITPKWPLPADDGAKQATTQLLRNLSALGARIHLCAIVADGTPIDEAEAISNLGVGFVTVIRRDRSARATHLRNLLFHPRTPITVAPYAAPRVVHALAKAVGAFASDHIVYDGLHCGAWELTRLGRDAVTGKSRIYRAHNVERDIWVRAAKDAKSPVKRAFLNYQARLMGNFESRLCTDARVVFPVSEIDVAEFRKMVPGLRAVDLPIGIAQPPQSTSGTPTERKLLFVGKLDWPPNRDGLRWILEKVWPQAIVRAPDLRLDIVGSGDGSWLKPLVRQQGVHFLGRVPSVTPHYEACAATLVPVFYGSGTRVKAIEASLHSRVCISTAVGVEGIGLEAGKSFVQAESEADWISALTEFDTARALTQGATAHTFVSKKFDPARIATRFLENL